MTTLSKHITQKTFAVVFSIFFIVVVVVLLGSYRMSTELEKQLQQNLEDVANQNSFALYSKIESHYLLLDALSKDLHHQTPETIGKTMHAFTNILDTYHLKRFAYVFPNGSAYSTDGETADLSYRAFFQRGLIGKPTISDVLHDALDDSQEQVNVMTVPIFDETGDVEGVFGLTFHTESFNEVLQVDCFDGQGYSCVFNSEGNIMIAMGNDTLQLSQNIITDVLSSDSRNALSINALRRQIRARQSGFGTIYLDEKSYYHCTPVPLMDGDVTWYIMTIVPAQVLDSRVIPLQRTLYTMTTLVIILILVGIGLVALLARERAAMALKYAYEDPLTQGANFAKFSINMKERQSPSGYLVSMDIANFSTINIAAGKETGNKVICDIWNILKTELNNQEMAGHVREDQYVFFLTDSEKSKLIERLQHISSHIHELVKNLQVKGIHPRYGIYHMDKSEELEDAYNKAKLTREQLKLQRDHTYMFFDEMDMERMQQDHLLEERFDDALAEGDFEVWYQPKYSVASGEIVGSEALVRWRRKNGDLIPPGRFIPLLEQNGTIAKLDEFMFRSVCEQQAKWLQEGKKIHPASINLSRASLYYTDIVEKYLSILQESGVESKYIQLEITESALEGKVNIFGLLEQFREKGIKILMDDFGAGYSSLSTLSMKCFDTLKLDKSLVDHIGESSGETLLYHVINMGQNLGLHITAEGVETNLQLDFLKANKCDDIQGFLFAKPMPSSEFEALLQ